MRPRLQLWWRIRSEKTFFFSTTESGSNLVGKKKVSISTYGLKMGNNTSHHISLFDCIWLIIYQSNMKYMILAYVVFQSHLITFIGVPFWHCQLRGLIVAKFLLLDGGCISHYLKCGIIHIFVNDCMCLLILPSLLLHGLLLGWSQFCSFYSVMGWRWTMNFKCLSRDVC
jgi:hypothetical protein